MDCQGHKLLVNYQITGFIGSKLQETNWRQCAETSGKLSDTLSLQENCQTQEGVKWWQTISHGVSCMMKLWVNYQTWPQ